MNSDRIKKLVGEPSETRRWADNMQKVIDA